MLAPPVLGVPCQTLEGIGRFNYRYVYKKNAGIVNSKTLSIVGKKINKNRVGVPAARYFGFDCDD